MSGTIRRAIMSKGGRVRGKRMKTSTLSTFYTVVIFLCDNEYRVPKEQNSRPNRLHKSINKVALVNEVSDSYKQEFRPNIVQEIPFPDVENKLFPDAYKEMRFLKVGYRIC